MKRMLMLVAMIAIVSGLTAWYAGPQEDTKAKEKQAMLLNYGMMNDILYHLLVDEDYAAIGKDADVIVGHAKWLQNLEPSHKVGLATAAEFDAFALQLEGNATNLKLVAENLEKDKKANGLSVKHLRPAASMLYGQSLTMCVSCHQSFRGKAPSR